MAGGDENSSKDMGALIAAADALCRATGATVLLVHHTPRNGDNLRGHTSLEGAVDTAIRVKQTDNGFALVCEKQKNAAKFEDIYLALIPTGESCVVGTPVTSNYFQIDDHGRKMLEALQAADLGEGLSTTRWQAVSGVTLSTFYRRQKDLVDRGFVGSNGPEKRKTFTLTDLGKEELSA
jgi:predicted transcriptional regulator